MKGQVQAGPTVGGGLTFAESKYRMVLWVFSRGREPGVGARSPSSEPLICPSVSRAKSKWLTWDTDGGGTPGRAQGGLRAAGEIGRAHV